MIKFPSINIGKIRNAFPFLALIPPVFLALFFFSKMEELKLIEDRITFLEKKALKTGALPVMTPSRKSDPHYLIRNFKGLEFQTLDTQKTPLYIETKEKQTQAICVTQEELKTILSLIEGVTIEAHTPPPGRPHLLIEEFELSKQSDSHFLLNMKLIKQELL